MKIKRRTLITIERSSTTTIRNSGADLERRVCPACGSATAYIRSDRAAAMLALPEAEIERALAAGEVHPAETGVVCAVSLVRRFLLEPAERAG